MCSKTLRSCFAKPFLAFTEARYQVHRIWCGVNFGARMISLTQDNAMPTQKCSFPPFSPPSLPPFPPLLSLLYPPNHHGMQLQSGRPADAESVNRTAARVGVVAGLAPDNHPEELNNF